MLLDEKMKTSTIIKEQDNKPAESKWGAAKKAV